MVRFVVRDCGFLWILIFYLVYKEESPSRGEICCPGLLFFLWILIFYFVCKEESPSRSEICCPGLLVFMDFDILF